jgi:predicted small lipoprotein YifL
MRRRIPTLLLLLVMLVVITGCGNKTTPENEVAETGSSDTAHTTDSAGTDSGEAEQVSEPQTFGIETPYGNFSYPKEYEDNLILDRQEDGDTYTITFAAKPADTEYQLFKVTIGGEPDDGFYGGQIEDADGNTHDYYITPYDLGDLTELDDATQNQLYAMQEALNELG